MRQELHAYVKMGVKKDGTIVALKHQLYWDVGASAEYGSNVVNATVFQQLVLIEFPMFGLILLQFTQIDRPAVPIGALDIQSSILGLKAIWIELQRH